MKKNHITVLLKILTDYCFQKPKDAHKKQFSMSCLQNFTTKKILDNHRERCLLINDT